MLRLMEAPVQTLFDNKVPAPIAGSVQTLPLAVEQEIKTSVENATAAEFLLKPQFLRDLGFAGDLRGDVLRWVKALGKQQVFDALQLPGGWQISAVTAGTCKYCLRDAQTALIQSTPGGGFSQVILLCDEHESEVLDHA